MRTPNDAPGTKLVGISQLATSTKSPIRGADARKFPDAGFVGRRRDPIRQGSEIVIEEWSKFYFPCGRIVDPAFADVTDCPSGWGRVFDGVNGDVGARFSSEPDRERLS